MANNKTDGRRIRGIAPYAMAWVHPSGETDPRGSKMVINTIDDTAHAIVAMDERGAALYARQVLSAAGIDIVGATRKVVEARAACANAPSADEHRTAARLLDEAACALAAELAKLDGALR